jgi:hypothetical protein
MECPLCFDADATVKVKGCRHSFCAACAKEWFTRNECATCPMCRGPFRCKEARVWIEEKMERDTLFEDGVNIILDARKVYTWIVDVVNGTEVMWGSRVSKMEKLKEFQLAYNAAHDWFFEDEEDFEEFVLNTDVSELTHEPRGVYFNDPTDRWFTKYPQLV